MIKLSQLIQNIHFTEIKGEKDIAINKITFDSRSVNPNDLFVAINGTEVDGHNYIQKAIDQGATVVVCEQIPQNPSSDITWLISNNSAKVLGEIASAYYGHPSQKMKLVGVTGTNGKTTIATLLFRMFTLLGNTCGLLSTIQNRIGSEVIASTHTTPDPLEMNALMKEMVDQNCQYCFMEVSSHAIVQERIAGLNFDGAIFTNITHDHLDYHKTFKNYLNAKKKFFDDLSKEAFAVTNIDDKNGLIMTQNTPAQVNTYSLKKLSDFKASILESHMDGMLLNIDNQEVWLNFVGNFNASNILAVYGTAKRLNIESQEILQCLSMLTPVEGRFEPIKSESGKYAIVDYAHTPDALKNVLQTIQGLRKNNQKIITVVGAGGDRDKTKRPEMAQEAISQSDLVVLTSDNPRTENPETIIEDMYVGIKKEDEARVLKIVDRKEAIRVACMLAQKGDIILIAGKGHEDYQIIGKTKHHFDDKEVVKELLN